MDVQVPIFIDQAPTFFGHVGGTAPTFQISRINTAYGSNWGHKIANFVFLPYISFILALTVLECIKRHWETLCDESR